MSDCHETARSFETFSLETVGSPKFLTQLQNLSALNVQAHKDAQAQSEDIVADAIYTQNKLPTLIHELILMDAWRKHLLPLLKNELNDTQIYFLIYYEATIVNLLEIICYHEHVTLSAEMAMNDLVDYCFKKLSALNQWSHSEQEDDTMKELDFSMAISTLSVFRYISEFLPKMPLSVIHRVLKRNDMIALCAQLIDTAPWLKKTLKGYQLFETGKWKPLSKSDTLLVSKTEGQVWLSLYNLLMDPECRKAYQYYETNYPHVIKLRDYLTETVRDQIPILNDLLRSIEELVIVQPYLGLPPNVGIEELTDISQKVYKNTNYTLIAKTQSKLIKEADPRAFYQGMASILDLDEIDTLIEAPKCGQCGQVAEQRCSKCRLEWYCSRGCQVKAWKKHKGVCDLVSSETRSILK